MKKLFLYVSLAALILSFGAAVFAQDVSTSSVGLTPDSPFYFLKNWKEKIQLFFTLNTENKAKQYLHLSEVRLAEYKKMLEQNKPLLAQKTLEKYEDQLSRAIEKIKELKIKGINISDLSKKAEDSASRNIEVLQNNLKKVPEAARKAIENAIASSTERLKEFRDIRSICVNKCGDGRCSEVVCLGSGCPCPETKRTCPKDCIEIGHPTSTETNTTIVQKRYVLEEVSRDAASYDFSDRILTEVKNGLKTIIIPSIKRLFGEYYNKTWYPKEVSFPANSSKIFLVKSKTEGSGSSGIFMIDVLNLTYVQLKNVGNIYENYSNYISRVSPDGLKTASLGADTLYLLNLLEDKASLLVSANAGEVFFLANNVSSFKWLDNYTIQYSVYSTKDLKLIELRKISIR